MAQILGGLVNIVVTPIYNLIFKHATYPFKVTTNVESLEKATKKLIAKHDDVNHKISNEERSGMRIKGEARTWLEGVSDIISEEVDIRHKYNNRGATFCGFSMNCWLNYKISKHASKKLLEVEQYTTADMNIVADQPVPPLIQEIPVSNDIVIDNDSNLRKALQYIKNDPVGVIGIWGVGGVGKTHLLNKINNSFLRDSSFHVVIIVTASKDCSVGKIQAEVVKKLGLWSDDDIKTQANIISDFLKEKEFLILLDDLWERIDLLEVGIPCPLGITENQLKRKVVITTRSQNVCGQMEVRKEIKVTCLGDKDAWQLFQEKVGQERLSSSSLIEELARQVVKELNGLPLALITVGRAMYAKIEPMEWEHVIDYMKQAYCDKDGPIYMETVFRQLKFNYDGLQNDTLKRCFLTCALWPEDYPIYSDELVQCWMGLGLVNENDIQSCYKKAISLRSDLKAACLLEGFETTSNIRMHDVVRDMARWISCGCSENNDNWVVHARVSTNLSRITIPWSKAECVSLMWSKMEELPPIDANCDSRKLRTLCLRRNLLDGRIVETLKNFTALTYLDLRSNNLQNIPEELCVLVNLEHLDLSYNSKIQEVPICFRDLTKLMFLYLSDTSIRRIPKGVISALNTLKVIDLMPKDLPRYEYRGYHMEYMPQILQELGNLSKLKAVGITVERVSHYESLSEFPKLPIRKLVIQINEEVSVFCLLSGPMSNHSVRATLYKLEICYGKMEEVIIERHESGGHMEQNYNFEALNKLTLSNSDNLKAVTWRGICPEVFFQRLTFLDIIDCNQLEHISWAMHLPSLERLWVQGCGKMRHAFLKQECLEKSLHTTFPRVRQMLFGVNKGLVSICDCDLAFPSLLNLTVWGCPNLKRLPFGGHNFPPNLQTLHFDSVDEWEKLEWEEDIKSTLEPFLKIGFLKR